MLSFFAMLFLTPAWITFIILQLMDKCSKKCCLCCQSCSPAFERTALDPERPFELIPWPMEDPVHDKDPIEMIVFNNQDGHDKPKP